LYVNKVISFNSSQDLSNFQAVNFHNQLAMTAKIEF